MPEFVFNGDFGYASESKGGGYHRVWFKEEFRHDEISFDSDVYLLLPEIAKELTANGGQPTVIVAPIEPTPPELTGGMSGPLFSSPGGEPATPVGKQTTVILKGEIPTEVWNRLGRTLIPKLKSGTDLSIALDVSVQMESDTVQGFQQELLQILRDLNLDGSVKVTTK